MCGWNHPNIVPFYGVYKESYAIDAPIPPEEEWYLVGALASEGSLEAYMSAHKPLPLDKRMKLV